ncbi:transketolase [Flavipsychrobacter stenotrophus]|uniref:3-methyl-2-oxobutanoate dehydrogenase (2-methylpropanoyl-transferring) n=1 Tax=Flavipsychrobacter stenotrophus TaxID=2077091 RepID=A0A2S7T0Z0_9BACT|nr:alpha-ketoacid dehydrogenase subunit alpha/beta [Flavipsychrobacter stenotrophus]PQJ12527.1 transketolase [Flavipsychrobacter stenotrophus]
MPKLATVSKSERLSFEEFKKETLADYRMAVASREASLIGRREVLTGKAKFGIFGDGKELAQIAAAKCFLPGDIRSGYYRDQTLMFATGMSDIQKFFAQLYADPNVENEPSTSGRMMNGHYGTRWLDEKGDWKDLTKEPQSSSDISPTAGQMVRALGLAQASKMYRNVDELQQGFEKFTNKGNEVIFCTIGDASTSEGLFWETINAAGVLQVPLAVFVWDDGYGISVPRHHQTTKNSISEALAGMQWDENKGGINIYTVKGWDYAGLMETVQKGIDRVRETHIPAIFHVQEVTQPQGHSTSGSHERYKNKERLDWEKEMDCIVKMKQFMLENGIGNEEELAAIEEDAKGEARAAKQRAWDAFLAPIKEQIQTATTLCNQVVYDGGDSAQAIAKAVQDLGAIKEPIRKDIMQTVGKVLALCTQNTDAKRALNNFYEQIKTDNKEKFSSHLYSQSDKSAMKVTEVPAQYEGEAVSLNGYEILNKFFDHTFATNPAVVAFGEDLGKIGDVNQGFAGLQDKYGAMRISDTGIREATIIGQGLGMAMRGLRPIAEIQYLDYLLYGLQPLSDDVSTMQYRTRGGQKCPIIVRTRGHRLEGVWHSGSPMGMIINSIRGMYLCVPRNMTQAAGMYNTLLRSDEPAIVVECLNGYRLKERVPSNLTEFSVPFGIPEVIREGSDITIVSYGSTLRVIEEAIVNYMEPKGISCEVIDVRTLLPFDINHMIVESLKKTNRIVFIDEDVPGGASAYMFQHVMEKQGGFRHLDVSPRTITAQAHRPAYATDGDYFSKPNAEDIAAVLEDMMRE